MNFVLPIALPLDRSMQRSRWKQVLQTLAALVSFSCIILAASSGSAAIALPAMFTDHMVLQRDMPIPVWGWGDPGEHVQVMFAGQTKKGETDPDGRWQVTLDPLPANANPQTMVIKGSNEVEITDVLVGEVWVCSGQSNMQWSVNQTWNADLTIRSAKHPLIRLITNNNAGVQVPLEDFEGAWEVCTPETVPQFSAVGYHFGVQLQQILEVPVGLIDNAWGGSSAEAWVERDRLEADREHFGPLMERWLSDESKPELRDPYEAYEDALLQWQQDAVAAKKAGEPVPNQPPRPNSKMVTQHRPENLFNGRVEPILPYAIRGVIWYQGESNASRAYQYRALFPLMIRNWRDTWQQGEFPFYWVQLADFRPEVQAPGESDWAELREAQTMTLDALDHTGQAVIIDIGEASDIHPRNKEEVGRRLARLALAQDYGIDIAHQSPRYDSLTVEGGKAIVSFRHCGGGLRTVDAKDVEGFAIAGVDQQWHSAQAQILDDKQRIAVWSDAVTEPVAVRYAWADNPVCNVFSQEGLPLTPFRTDDWPGITADNR